MGFQSVEGRGAVQLLRDESQDSCATCLGSITHGLDRSEQHNGRLNGREPYATACVINRFSDSGTNQDRLLGKTLVLTDEFNERGKFIRMLGSRSLIAKTLIFHALSVFPIFNDHSRISSLLSLFYISSTFHAQIRFFRSSFFTLKSDFFILLSSLILRPPTFSGLRHLRLEQ